MGILSLLGVNSGVKEVKEEKKRATAEEIQQVKVHLRKVQAGTLRFAARKLEKRARTITNLAVKTILVEEANDFNALAITLSAE